MTRMSKPLYIGIFIFSIVMIFLGGIPALLLLNSYELPRSMGIDDDITNLSVGVLIFLAIAPFVFSQIILILLVIYKMWSSIRDSGNARMTPGKAIGFLLIPFFNLYWIFQVWGGFPNDYNRFIDDQSLQVPKLSSGLYIAYPILVVFTAVPLFGLLAVPIAPLVFIFLMAKTSDAVNRLADARQQVGGSLRFPRAQVNA